MKNKLKKVKKPAKLLKNKKNKIEEPPKNKNNMQSMTIDDFMKGFSHVDENDITGDSDKEESEEIFNMENNSDQDEIISHKKQLDGLKKSDPEFYRYLEENDQDLLNFDDSEEDSDGEEKKEKFHKTPNELEVASDESDYEPDEEIKTKRKGASSRITTDMVKNWQEALSKGNIQALREVAEAFHAALVSVSPEDDGTAIYKVEGAVAFNSVIRMCIMDFLPGVQKVLNLTVGFKTHPRVSKNWPKVKPVLRGYLTDLVELSGVSSPQMLTVLLKHIHQMSPFIACFPALAPKFLKRVVQLWAMDEDVVRVLAFLCALRLANLRPSLLKQGLKIMHLTYVRNTKFVSPTLLPGINFMRKSLCEMFALDNTVSYHMAFIYIRQLAIHLRNAITLKKKDAYRTVYNWAYISSFHLWAELFSMVPRGSPLRSLVYPLIQIIIGTIKLIPSSQFYPLRFHCIRLLIHLSDKCGVFIPVLPFIVEVLTDFNFNREHKKLSMKPMDLTCLLRCSKSQMKENGFKDALVENVHDLFMEYLVTESHRMSFPDLTVPCVIEIKQFLKRCTVANYNKKIKVILDKITENNKFIESERRKLNIRLDDLGRVEAAETEIRAKEPPFLKYYESWKKIQIQQQARKITNNQRLGDYKLPVLYKLEKKRTKINTKKVGPPELFPSDDEDDDDDNTNMENFISKEEEEEEDPPKKRKKQEKEMKKVKVKVEKEKEKRRRQKEDKEAEEDDGDIVEDLEYSDFD